METIEDLWLLNFLKLFVIKKKDEILFKEWIESNFNDEDAKMLFENLSNAKVFIKEELNYLNRFWI